MSASVPPPPPASSPAPADPFPPGLQRLLALSGVGVAVLFIAAIAVNSAETPDFTAPATEWATYVQEEDSALKLSALLFAFASFLLLCFAGVVRAALGGAEAAARGFVRLGYIVLAGFTFSALCLGAAAAVLASLGGLADAEPEVVRSVNVVGAALFGASSIGFAAAFDAAGFIIIRTRVLPVWLGFLALFVALCELLTLFFLLDVADDENIFGFFYPLGFLGMVVWFVAVSVILTRRVGAEPVHVQRYE